MALIREESDSYRERPALPPLVDPSICSFEGRDGGQYFPGTLANSSPSTLGQTGRAKILPDPLVRSLLLGGLPPESFASVPVTSGQASAILSDVRRSLDDGRFFLKRGDARLGEACRYWFVLVPSPRPPAVNPRTGRPWSARPWAINLDVLVSLGLIDEDTAGEVFRFQRSDVERERDASSMSQTLREAREDERRFESERPGFLDYVQDSFSDVFDSISTASLFALGVGAILLLNSLRK